MTKAEILEIQRQLGVKADGIYGPVTAQAYQRWLDDNAPADPIKMPTPAPPAAKPWWTSRALLGLMASVLAMLAGRFGLEIDDATLTPILLQIVELVGLCLAAWGTITRTAPIDATLVARVGAKSIRLPIAHSMPADRPDTQSPGPFGY